MTEAPTRQADFITTPGVRFWDNDEVYEQTFTLKIAPKSIKALQTPATPVDSPADFARDPRQTGGQVQMQAAGDQITFTGAAAYYPADPRWGRNQAATMSA